MVRVQLLLTVALFVEAGTSARAEPSRFTPGQVFRECTDCPQMVVVPSGRFRMGSKESETGTSSLEQPAHWVSIRKFAAGRFDVTRGEWAAFVRATHRRTQRGCLFTGRAGDSVDPQGSWSSLGFAQTGRHPVVCINWQDATDYARWLSKRTGKPYRLLSEAEWEYAARAGSETPFDWGAKARHSRVNYGSESGYGKGVSSGRDKWIYTSPVGSFPPNRFGLYDMSGNVLQFVEDCLGTYDRTPGDGSPYTTNEPLKLSGELADLSGTMSCSYRVARGGDWGDPPEAIRSASRNFAPPPPGLLNDYRSGGLGFRVARDLSR